MRRNAFVLLSVLLLLSASSSVYASVNPLISEFDCDGWRIYGNATFSEGVSYIDATITLRILQNGTLVDEIVATGIVEHDGSAAPPFEFSGTWDIDLCGTYTVEGSFDLESPWWNRSYPVSGGFTCECDPGGGDPVCNYPPVYWLNNPDLWPAEELTLGCVDYSKDKILAIFARRPFRSLTVAILRQLAAAKLNVINGADPSIEPWIAAGDDFICKYPVGSRVAYCDWKPGLRILYNLFTYNWRPCDYDYCAPMYSVEGMENGEAATEETSWGSIKKMHR